MSLVDEFADFVGSVPYREVDLPWGRAQVWDVGAGRPIVLLHGIAAGRRIFFRLVPLLASGHRVIVPPLRGEDAPAPRAAWDAMLEDIAALFRALDVEDATLFGTSFGGALALGYGARSDPRVKEIKVQGTFKGFRLRPGDRLAHLVSYAAPPSAGSAYFARRVRRGPEMKLLAEHAPGIDELFPGWCAATPFATLRRRIALLHALDLSDAVRGVRVPLAFLHGAKDRVVPRAFFEELRRLRPDAPATLLEGGGHNLPLTHHHVLGTWLGERKSLA
jgi:pimeloyl-ACP methyl ester carboxylesterase